MRTAYELVAADQLEEAFDRMTDGLLVLDPDLRLVFVSTQAARLVNRTVDEMVGRILPEEFPDSEAFISRYRIALRDQQPLSFDEYYAPIGKWLNVRVYPSPTGLTIFFLDATERVAAQQQLEDERQRLRAIISSMPVAVFIVDARGGVVYMNERVRDIWGEARHAADVDDYEQYRGRWVDSGVPLQPRDWAATRALHGEVVIGDVVEIERFDGRHVTILNNATPIKDEKGAITGAVIVAQEISEQIKLEEQLRESLDATNLLLQAANALNTWTDLRSLLQGLAEVTLRAIGHRRVTISLVDEDHSALTLVAGAGDAAVPAGTVVPWEQVSSELQMALEQRRSRIVDYDRLAEHEAGTARAHAGRLALLVPLVFGGRTLGHLGIDDPGERREFTVRQVSVAEGIAAQAAVAIQNARLFEQRSTQATYAEALNAISWAVHSTLNVDEIMRRAVFEIRRALDVDGTAVHMHMGDHWEFTYELGLPDELAALRLSDDQAKVSMTAVTLLQPIVVSDVLHDSRANVRLMEQFGVTSLAAVPLVVRDEAIGVLFVGCLGGIRSFPPAQVTFLEQAADTLALSLENARLYESERHIADRLQEALLTMPGHVPGVEFAHAYHSATEAARVGGDFYDLFEMEHGLVGIVMGDVAGKGLEAAVTTSFVKNVIRAHVSDKGAKPAEILRLTNDVLHASTPAESFVTVLLAALDPLTGWLAYASAGHTTGAIVGEEREMRPLPPTGPILGAFPGVTFRQAELVLGPEDRLILYTDGLSEARVEGALLGEERVLELGAANAGLSPHEMISAIIEEVLELAGGRLDDDLAMLVLRRGRGGEGSHVRRTSVR